MGLFSFGRPKVWQILEPEGPIPSPAQIPVNQVDLSKRYDVYCSGFGHDRLYENVRFVGIRTFDRISKYDSGLVSGYLEIEAVDGSRFLIPTFGIQLICDHGTPPMFKVLRRRKNQPDY